MDYRRSLEKGSVLPFPGMSCHIEKEIGRGSNALVYKAWYEDVHRPELHHHVLVKELFPYDPEGNLIREKDGSLCIREEAKELYELHRFSFESANEIHLQILASRPDGIGGNLNTFALNRTLYSILAFDGGMTLSDVKNVSLEESVSFTEDLLEALNVFHENQFLHLDISPDNILVIGNGKMRRLMLIDFNSVRSFDEAETGLLYKSFKEGFTPPELQRRSGRKASCASDLYAVGGVFYWLMTGHILTGDVDRNVCDSIPLLDSAPETVRAMVQRVLVLSRFLLASKRYQTAGEMLRDLHELKNRMDGVGVTHWALWESGRRNAERFLRENPALSYITHAQELYPMRIRQADGSLPDSPDDVLSGGRNALLLGTGGSGKTSFLLHCIHSAQKRYTPSQTALFYIPLNACRNQNGSFIRNRLLETLKFGEETASVEEARHQLELLLDTPLKAGGKEKPAVCLLLDGLNEVSDHQLQPLLDEILLLSKKRGVQLLVSSRTAVEGLPFDVLSLCPLEPEDVQSALRKHQLLIPDDAKMLESLRTPLMLSLYIQTLQQSDKQTVSLNPEELIDAYLESLCTKEMENEPDQSSKRWQLDVALHYILPVLAWEISKQKSALSNETVLSILERCWKNLHSKWMLKVFPQWIGRIDQIFDECGNAGSWMGRMVLDILWQRMGLLVRDQENNWSISHQSLMEALAPKGQAIYKDCFRRRGSIGIILGCVAMLLVCLGLGTYAYVNRPYDDKLAEDAVDYIGTELVQINRLIEYGRDFLDDPSPYAQYVLQENLEKEKKKQDGRQGLQAVADLFDKMLKTGTRIKETGFRFDKDAQKAFAEMQETASALVEKQQEYLSLIGEDGSMSESFSQKWAEYLDSAEKLLRELYEKLLKGHHDTLREEYPDKYGQYDFIVKTVYDKASTEFEEAELDLHQTVEYGNHRLDEPVKESEENH